MDRIKEVKEMLISNYFSLHKTNKDGQREPNLKYIDYVAHQIYKLFKPEPFDEKLEQMIQRCYSDEPKPDKLEYPPDISGSNPPKVKSELSLAQDLMDIKEAEHREPKPDEVILDKDLAEQIFAQICGIRMREPTNYKSALDNSYERLKTILRPSP